MKDRSNDPGVQLQFIGSPIKLTGSCDVGF